MAALFVEPRSFLRKLGRDLSLLAETRTLLKSRLAFFLLLHQIVSSQLNFLETQCVKRVADPHLHHSAELRDRSPRSLNPPLRSNDAVSYTHLRAHETRHDLVC